MTASLAAYSAFSLFFGALIGLAQPQPPVFHAETSAVAVDVIVTDRRGHHMSGLAARDFRLYEDRTQQTIASFTDPAARAGRQPATGVGAITNNGTPPGPTQPPRAPQLVTLVIDLGDLHYENLKRACGAASQFAEKTIAAGNSIAVYWVDFGLHLALPFTQDKRKALEAIQKLSVHVPSGRFTARERERAENDIDDLFTALYPETVLGGPPQAKNPDPTPTSRGKGSRPTPEQELAMDAQREQLREMNMLRSWLTIASSLQARAVFVALRAIAVSYRDLPGRKSVIVFSEGFLHSREAEPEMQAVIDAANRAGLAIYVIDASGLSPVGSAETRISDLSCGKRATQDFSNLGAGLHATGLNQFDWLQTMGSDLDGDLAVVASGTGGFLVKDTNALGPALERVVDDASEFYTLVYYPSNRNYDGAFRSIKVELAQKGYHLRYRQGYWAIPPGREIMMTPAAAQLIAAIESGGRQSGFVPELNAVIVLGQDGRFDVSAAVSMPGNLVRFDKSKDEYGAGVTLLLLARDLEGRLLAVHERYGDVHFKRQERVQFSSKTFNMQGHVAIPELQPVSVQAIVQLADGTVGVSGRTEIRPLPNSPNLRLTSLVLSDQTQDSECRTDPMDPLCVKGVRIFLPAQPQFARSARLYVYFSVLGVSVDDAQRPGLGLTFNLRNAESVLPLRPEKIEAAPCNISRAFLVLADFDLHTLPPGEYTLEMTAEDRIAHAKATESAQLIIQ